MTSVTCAEHVREDLRVLLAHYCATACKSFARAMKSPGKHTMRCGKLRTVLGDVEPKDVRR